MNRDMMKMIEAAAISSVGVNLAALRGQLARGVRVADLTVTYPPPPADLLETPFRRKVIALARDLGWKAAHFRTAMTRDGKYVTAVDGDGVGYPDLTLVRDRVVFAELKSKAGVLSDAQKAWRDALIGAGQEWHLWRPAHWNLVVEVLRPDVA